MSHKYSYFSWWWTHSRPKHVESTKFALFTRYFFQIYVVEKVYFFHSKRVSTNKENTDLCNDTAWRHKVRKTCRHRIKSFIQWEKEDISAVFDIFGVSKKLRNYFVTSITLTTDSCRQCGLFYYTQLCTTVYFFVLYILIQFVTRFGACYMSSSNETAHEVTKRWFNPLKPELNPICYLLALLGAHHFLHASRIRVKLLTFRLLMSYIYGAPVLDVSRSHTTTQHSR